MKEINVRFISANKYKIAEAEKILAKHNIKVVPVSEKIEEIQTQNTNRLVRDKLLQAFQRIGRPLFVEHTGLYLEYLNGFPGGLTQIFWDSLKADKFAKLFGNTPNPKTVAKTVVAYTNGKSVQTFEGEISGRIAKRPKGNREFQWDCVFVPSGYRKTFSELGDLKNEISMRRKALDKLADFIRKHRCADAVS